MSEETGAIIDAENYRGKEANSYKDIVMSQVKKCVTNLSKEMTAGFWVYNIPNPQTRPLKIKYVNDTREELIQSIDTLYDLLLPKFDKKAKEEIIAFYKESDKEEISTDNNRWKKVLPKYRGLFQQLCLFLERLGWLEDRESEYAD